MRLTSLIALLLLWPGMVCGQINVGARITPEQVEKAKADIAAGQKLIDLAKGTTWQLNVGEFLTVDPPANIQGPFLWIVTDDSLLKKIDVPAATPFVAYLRHAGEAEQKVWQYAAKPSPWSMLIGQKEGTTIITVIVNGTAGQPPVVIDKLTVTVGRPKPPPPPPDADPLIKAANADIAAGKGTQEDVDFYREYLLQNAAGLPGLTQYKTSKDYWAAFAQGLVSITGKLPTMRDAVGKAIDAAVPEKEGDPFDADRRAKLAVVLKALAARLEAK